MGGCGLSDSYPQDPAKKTAAIAYTKTMATQSLFSIVNTLHGHLARAARDQREFHTRLRNLKPGEAIFTFDKAASGHVPKYTDTQGEFMNAPPYFATVVHWKDKHNRVRTRVYVTVHKKVEKGKGGSRTEFSQLEAAIRQAKKELPEIKRATVLVDGASTMRNSRFPAYTLLLLHSLGVKTSGKVRFAATSHLKDYTGLGPDVVFAWINSRWRRLTELLKKEWRDDERVDGIIQSVMSPHLSVLERVCVAVVTPDTDSTWPDFKWKEVKTWHTMELVDAGTEGSVDAGSGCAYLVTNWNGMVAAEPTRGELSKVPKVAAAFKTTISDPHAIVWKSRSVADPADGDLEDAPAGVMGRFSERPADAEVRDVCVLASGVAHE